MSLDFFLLNSNSLFYYEIQSHYRLVNKITKQGITSITQQFIAVDCGLPPMFYLAQKGGLPAAKIIK